MTTKSHFEENELLAKIAQGDHLAFKVLYDGYYGVIFDFSYRLLHSESLAEEVIQETMLHIWLMGSKLKAVRNIEAYIKTIARRRAIDQLRIAEQALNFENDFFAAAGEDMQDNEEALVLESARLALAQGIEKLPDQQREVYLLCYQQGLKYQQVAEKLNISHGTVQTHMKLALKFLREYIKKHSHYAVIAILFRLF
jgi:RNA polymerase sigma-70 factor (family 1)